MYYAISRSRFVKKFSSKRTRREVICGQLFQDENINQDEKHFDKTKENSKMKKRIFALLLAAVMILTLAAGCGNDQKPNDSKPESKPADTQTSSTAQNDSAAEPSGEVVTLRWGGWDDPVEFEKSWEGMEEAIGVKIEFQKYPTDADFWNNLPAQIAAKTAPDMVSLTNELYLPYIRDGLIVPIDSYINDGTITGWDEITPNIQEIWQIDGQIYGMPYRQCPAVFAINMNLWNEAGLTEDDFPETWDDVLDVCKVFKDKLNMTGLCFNTQEYHFTNYCLSFGGGWGLGKTIDTPENAAAFQFIIDAYRQGYVVTPKELGVSYDGNVVMSGDAAMSTGGSWYVSDFMRNAPDIKVRYLPVPHAKGKDNVSGTLHAPAMTILKGTAHEKEAAMAMNYIYNNPNFPTNLIDIGFIPMGDHIDEFVEKQPELADQVKTVATSQGFGYPAAGKAFADAMISKMEEALFNSDSTLTGAQIVKELAEEFGE